MGSHEQYNSALDFGNYASFSSGSPSGYSHPSAGHAKASPSFGGPYSGASPAHYKGGKGGTSSSYISIVHGPGGGGSPSKVRSHGSFAAASKTATAAAPTFHGANFGPASAFVDGKFGSSNAYANQVPSFGGGGSSSAFGKLFGSGGAYSGGGGGGSGGFDFAGSGAEYNKGYEGGASDEVGSYSSGGPSYATFTGSKPSYSQGSRGNAYSTSNINFGGGSAGGKVGGGHANFHPPSFAANFKPSGSKTYNRYQSPSGGYSSGGSTSSASFGSNNPLVGSESGYNSRALKTGYTVDGADDFDSAENANLFSGFSDGAGFKVQSSYSSNRPFSISTYPPTYVDK